MARRPSRIIGKTLTVSWDDQQRPLFGSTSRTVAPTRKEERRAEAKTRKIPTLEEHAAFLQSVGHPAYLIPGTPERIDMLRRWIEHTHPVEAQDYRQLERWQKELIKCLDMKPLSSPAN